MHVQNLSAIDLNLLVVLEALLRERHVTRAASRVGLSQSATSHALARLRELYDDPLLVRNGARMSLTPRAVALLPAVECGLSELRRTISGEPPFDPKSARRIFTLGGADYCQAVLLPSLLGLLEREAPNVDLEVVNAPNLYAMLEEGLVDVALLVGPAATPSLRSRELFSDGFTCMIRKNHPLVKGKLTLARYLELRHVVVAPSGSPGSVVDAELARRGKKRRVAVRVPSFLVAPLVVAQSDFVNTGPERLARLSAARHPIRIVPAPLPVPGFTVHLTWHARLESDPAHQWLRGIIERVSASV